MGYSNLSPSQRGSFLLYKFCTCAQISIWCKPIQLSFENQEHQCLTTLGHTLTFITLSAWYKRCFQEDISSRPFILCRPGVCLLSSSKKTKTNEPKKEKKKKNQLHHHQQKTNTNHKYCSLTISNNLTTIFLFFSKTIFLSWFILLDYSLSPIVSCYLFLPCIHHPTCPFYVFPKVLLSRIIYYLTRLRFVLHDITSDKSR